MNSAMFRSSLLVICLAVISAVPASAGLIGTNFQISGVGCRFPDVAYGSVSGKYLVVWTDYNNTRVYGRFVTNGGAVSGGVFLISEAGALFPAVAYNATNNEFLVTWDDQRASPFPIWGQRVRGSDGVLLGGNFAIFSTGGIRSAVSWSSSSNNYLVACWGASEILARRVSNTGAVIGGEINVSADGGLFSGYPAISYGSNGNQYLVTWDHDDGNIRARRVDAGTGGLLGSAVVMTSGNANDRSCSAYDSANSRWAVQYNKQIAGLSYNQWGRIINTSGTLVTGEYAIANTPGFEGDTQFGGDICFGSGISRYFTSFGTDTGWGAQETNTGGGLVGGQIVIGTGAYTSGNNAADAANNRFFPVWEGAIGSNWYVWGQLWQSVSSGPCFSDSFAYANGNLNGNGSWSGSAGSQIQIVSQTVKVNGGATSFDANRTVSCGASGGFIQIAAKVQKGTGASTMWSLWFDNPSGVNICRWYGTGTTARGRIGSSGIVTAEQTLTGGWDNLLVKINPTTQTAEFIYNSVSIGTLNYSGQGAGGTLGRLRFERINNSGAAGHFLSFDDLVVN